MSEVLDAARRAKAAAAALAPLPRKVKDEALLAMADALVAETARILEANARDVEAARAQGTAEGLVDRLTLTESRIAAMADSQWRCAASSGGRRSPRRALRARGSLPFPSLL